jgi:acyl carrier protein
MEFSREEVLKIVIDALKEAQEDFPEGDIEIEEETKPIGGLAYFDSLASVVVTVRCMEALGYSDELPMPTLFIGRYREYLTVGKVADRILTYLKKKK